MVDARIHDGDILVVDRSISAVPNRIVIVTSSVEPDHLFVKMFGQAGRRPALLSRNAARSNEYPPIYLDEHTFEFWGVVTGVLRKL